MTDSPLPSPITDHTQGTPPAPAAPAAQASSVPMAGSMSTGTPAYQPTNGVAIETGRGYVGLGPRFWAGFIDMLILAIPNFIISAATAGLGSIIFVWLYFAFFHAGEKQATPGQRVMGMVITDMSGNRLSFGKASGQYFASYISAILLLAGYIMIAFTEKKQGLHDMMAGTLHYYRVK